MSTIESGEVFEAVRRAYPELAEAGESEILDYFGTVNAEALRGHLNNVKGVLFEQEYARNLQEEGCDARLFEETNHPVSDLAIYDDDHIVEELQLKATDSAEYIEETLRAIPEDVTVVTTSEVAGHFGEEVVDSGISDALLEEAVADTLIPTSPFSIVLFFLGGF